MAFLDENRDLSIKNYNKNRGILQMYKTILTIGLNDKDAETQLIKTEEARAIIENILINECNILAFTAFECTGVYRMYSTGHIVREQSIRVEIVDEVRLDTRLDVFPRLLSRLKCALNQESIMIEIAPAEVYFR